MGCLLCTKNKGFKHVFFAFVAVLITREIFICRAPNKLAQKFRNNRFSAKKVPLLLLLSVTYEIGKMSGSSELLPKSDV